MELYFVRHGEAEYRFNSAGLREQDQDGYLTPIGHHQAQCLAQHFRTLEIDRLYSSPLLRARQTAEYLTESLGIRMQTLPWLKEIDVGDLSSYTKDEINSYFQEAMARPLEKWWEGFEEDGETFMDFYNRVTQGLDTLLNQHGATKNSSDYLLSEMDTTRICIVAHGGTISVMLSYLLRLTPVPWEWYRFNVSNTGVSRVEFTQIGGVAKPCLALFNSTHHIESS